MSDKVVEDSKVEETRSTRRVSARVAARAAKEETGETKETNVKKRAAGKEKPKPSKKAKLEEEDELEDDKDEDPALKPLEIGDPLPSLTLKNEKGENIEISKLADDQGIVIFLVPKADTPGCTRQACGFRDSLSDIKALNFGVYCLSADSPSVQAKWQTKKTLSYSLISDPKRVFISALGAGEGGKTKRSHFIFEKGGKMIEKKLPVKPDVSPAIVLKFIQEIKKD